MKRKINKPIFKAALTALLFVLAALVLVACTTDITESSFEINANNVDCKVLIGETPDWSKLIVKVKMSDKSEKILTSDKYSLDTSGFNNQTAGEHTVKVTVPNLGTKDFKVYVASKTVRSVKVVRDAVPNTVGIGSTFEWDNLGIILVYDYDIERASDVAYTVDASAYNPSVVGTYTIKVNCEYGQATFTVAVSDTGTSAMFDDDKRVYFAHKTYTLTGATNVKLKDAQGNITNMPDGTLTNLVYGDYTLTYTQNGENISREIRVIYELAHMALGNDYIEYQRASGPNGGYLRKNAITNYLVGTANAFRLTTNTEGITRTVGDDYQTVKLNGTEWMFNIVLSVYEGNSYVVKDDIATHEGFSFDFNNKYAGKKIQIVITPRYEAVTPSTTITVFVELNEGLNAHNFDEFAQLYGNLDTQILNLHTTIVLNENTLKPNQLNPDGSVKNFKESFIHGEVVYEGEKLVQNNSGNIFVRVSKTTKNSNLVVNGNYFSIDGEKLPYITPPPDGIGSYPGQTEKLVALGISTNYRLTNLQSAIFYNSVTSADFEANLRTAHNTVNIVGGKLISDGSKETLDNLENNSVTINNLTIEANGRSPRAQREGQSTEEFMRTIEKESGAYIGIRAYHMNINANNMVMRFTGLGLSVNSSGCDFEADYTLVEENFCNNIFGNGNSEVILKNSKIGISGGAAVMSEQTNTKNGSIYDFNLTLKNTEIKNYIMGTEAWFTIWGFNAIIPTMKTTIEDAVRQYTFGEMAILKQIEMLELGYTAECFNFAVLITESFENKEGATELLSSITIDDMPRNPHSAILLNSLDPRVQGGQFLAPLNKYSRTDAFAEYLVAVGADVQGKIISGVLDYGTIISQFGSVETYVYLTAMQNSFKENPVDSRWLEIYVPIKVGTINNIQALIEYGIK